jgi:hypothetical protein
VKLAKSQAQRGRSLTPEAYERLITALDLI